MPKLVTLKPLTFQQSKDVSMSGAKTEPSTPVSDTSNPPSPSPLEPQDTVRPPPDQAAWLDPVMPFTSPTLEDIIPEEFWSEPVMQNDSAAPGEFQFLDTYDEQHEPTLPDTYFEFLRGYCDRVKPSWYIVAEQFVVHQFLEYMPPARPGRALFPDIPDTPAARKIDIYQFMANALTSTFGSYVNALEQLHAAAVRTGQEGDAAILLEMLSLNRPQTIERSLLQKFQQQGLIPE